MKHLQYDKLNQKGISLLETVIVVALMLLVLVPLMSVYIQSVTNMYVVDKLTEAQKQANNVIFFLSQDLGGADEFLSISSTFVIVRSYKETTVGFYRNPSDNTLRRISNMSFSGGEIKARYIKELRFTYYQDATFTPITNPNDIHAMRFDVVIDVPASDLTNPNSLDTAGYSIVSYVWPRNGSTL